MRFQRALAVFLAAIPAASLHAQIGQFGGGEASLKVGDPAPALSIAEWIKGKPVNLADGKGKNVYVVEFWATWCGPCQLSIPELTKVQAEYGDKGVTCVGVTSADRRGNTLEAVKAFVAEWGDRMNYTVAFDKDTATNDAYMTASNQFGIPMAFVVDRGGKIAWIGTPIGPELHDVVSGVLDGRFDPKKYEQVQAKLLEASNLAQTGDMKAVLKVVDEVLELDPGHVQALEAKVIVYLSELKDRAGLREWASAFIGKNKANPRALRSLANQLMTNQIALTDRMPDLALEAARGAFAAGGDKDADSAEVYALSLYQIGAVGAAAAVQSKAVQASNGQAAEQRKEVLEFYKTCEKLQQDVKTP